MLAADREYQAARERLTVAAYKQVGTIWREVGDDFDRGWPIVAPAIVATITDAQEGAAADGLAYFDAALVEQDITPQAPRIDPAAFAGVAYSLDGLTTGDLDSLTYGSVVHARTAPATSLSERIDAGSRWLGRITQTQLSQAGRASMSVAMTSDAQTGWTRTVNPPCCRFCAVRAGTFHTWNYPFWQHTGCDCTRTPTTFDRLGETATDIGPDDVTYLTDAQREAMREGADLGRIINSERGISEDRMTTTAQISRRNRGRTRLTPDGIYAVSATREEAIERLRQYGYIYL